MPFTLTFWRPCKVTQIPLNMSMTLGVQAAFTSQEGENEPTTSVADNSLSTPKASEDTYMYTHVHTHLTPNVIVRQKSLLKHGLAKNSNVCTSYKILGITGTAAKSTLSDRAYGTAQKRVPCISWFQRMLASCLVADNTCRSLHTVNRRSELRCSPDELTWTCFLTFTPALSTSVSTSWTALESK